MAVTRLERKGQKNKSRAKQRVATIKRLKTKTTVASPFKEESGVVVGTISEFLDKKKPSPKAKKADPETSAEAEVTADTPAKAEAKVEEVEADTAEAPEAEGETPA